MRVLLDTHIFLWAVMDSRLLKAEARGQMLAADEVYVSAASIWEIAMKARLGKIEGDPERLARAVEESGFIEPPVREPVLAVGERQSRAPEKGSRLWAPSLRLLQ